MQGHAAAGHIDREQLTEVMRCIVEDEGYSESIKLTWHNPTDGVVKQTGAHRSHFTWWRTTTFNLSNLKMLQK